MSDQNNDTPNGFKKTEIGIIPEDWEVVKVKDVAKKMKAGGTPRKSVKEYWENGKIPFVLIEDMTKNNLYIYDTKERITTKGLDNSSAWIVPPNSLLLSMYATIGETAINKIPVATNQAILAIIPNKNFDVVYGAYCLKYHSKRLIMQNIQSTQKNVNRGIVENFLIPLPPLPEQKKIAHVLSTIQEAKEGTEAVIKAAKELKKSLTKYLFTYGPVPLNEAENVKLKETEIGLIPEEWEVVKLGDVLLKAQYGLSKRASDSGKYPMIRMNNMINGKIDVSDLKYIDLDEEEYQKFKVNKGDILFNRTNSIELVGKTSLFDLDLDCVFASYIIRLSLDTQRLMPEFLNYYMNIDATQKNLKKLASRGVSQSNISATKLKTFKVPIPPLHIQQKIASILSAVDEKIEKEENKKKALEELFKSMLHNLMTGKVRVKDLDIEIEMEKDGETKLEVDENVGK